MFCDGINVISTKTGLPTNRIGMWKFYFPNGELEHLQEYDKDGKLINQKTYSLNGTLIYSETVTDNITNANFYYDNGKIKTESISKIVTESNGDDDSETTHETLKEYLPNGLLYSQSNYKDGNLEGLKNIWDTTGNLVLSIEYKNGLIIQKK